MIKPDKSKQDSKKIQIKDMFNDISSRYDQINKMMTLNMMALDAKEGISAFLEKRKPKWKNR